MVGEEDMLYRVTMVTVAVRGGDSYTDVVVSQNRTQISAPLCEEDTAVLLHLALLVAAVFSFS